MAMFAPAKILFIAVILISRFSVAQESGAIITGRVVDSESAAPLEAASVYLRHSLLGSATDIQGAFRLEYVPKGRHALTVSRIGYETFSKEIEIRSNGERLEFDVRLQPEVYALDDIDITADQPRRWRQRFERFNKLFLGTMPFEEQARILNPYALEFEERRGMLSAFAPEILVIENKGLGYRIHFQLMGFQWNRGERILRFSGAGYFEYLTPEDERERQLWIKNRSGRGGNYSWLAHANPSSDGAWKARTIQGRCACNIYNFGPEADSVCRCTYRGLMSSSGILR